MKNLTLSLAFLFIAGLLHAQKDSTLLAPYQRFPTVPPFKLQLLDEKTMFTKENLSSKSATMIMFFSPDCEHCQHEMEEIIKQIDDFKKVQIVLATTLPMDRLKTFYDKYDLKRFDNIIVGKDSNYFLPGFFAIHNLPYLAFYNKKKELISVFEGNMAIPNVLSELEK